MYRLTIEKVELNPNFKEEVVPYGVIQNREIVTKSLSTEVTEEEFQAIKKAVLEAM